MFEIGSQVGKYVLESELGNGGFGEVFVARDPELERTVALKVLRPEHTANPQVVQRFLQEARSAAKVAHPGIVTVFECGQVPDAAYIVMELLQGETVARRIRHQRLTESRIVEIARQVASALHAAHMAGIIHRDLKPDNLFLVRDPAAVNGERIKILDFGIAKLAEAVKSGPETGSLMVFGTPAYMSPEQCRSSGKVDHRADIYSLGCILHELVTGAPPFSGEFGELIGKHLFVEPPALRSLAPDVSPGLESAIERMLEKDPEQRVQSMADVLELFDAPTPNATGDNAGRRPPTGQPTVATGFGHTTLNSSNGSIEALGAVPVPRRRRRKLFAGILAGAVALGAAGTVIAITNKSSTQADPATQPVTSPADEPRVDMPPPPPPPVSPATAPAPTPEVAAPAAPSVEVTRPKPEPTSSRRRKVRTKVAPAPAKPEPAPSNSKPEPPECAKPPCNKLDGAL